MAQSEPSWWYNRDASWQRTLLRPAASLYGQVAAARAAMTSPMLAARPVICVGNYTAGGTGKTPMALLIASIVEKHGGAPWFLSRGYGGRLDGQERVDLGRHTAAEVGDEPLLLAARAPTVISRDRRLGAEFIVRQASANAVIIMDDGLQNPTLAKNLTVALIDAARGLGNGAVIPAGPLRAPLAFQLARTDIMIVNGTTGSRARQQLRQFGMPSHLPILSAESVPNTDATWLAGKPVIAFAGIANPERFFQLIERLGGSIADRITFRDHETLSDAAARDLLARAKKASAVLVTTEKDFVRLAGLDGARAALQQNAKTLGIELRMPEVDYAVLSQRIAKLINQ